MSMVRAEFNYRDIDTMIHSVQGGREAPVDMLLVKPLVGPVEMERSHLML
jgi:hypothetical protein